MVRAVRPVAMACLMLVSSVSACGDGGGDTSSSTASTASSTTATLCPEVAVVVAAKDIPAGTTGADAAANGMLREDVISARYRPATAVTSLDQVANAVVIADVVENEIVSFEHFGLPTDTTLAAAAPSCSSDGPPTTADG